MVRCRHSVHGLFFRGCQGSPGGGQQQFATQTLRVHLLGLEIRALILANIFRVPELNPFFCESRFAGLKIANRTFEAIRANRSHLMKIEVFFGESIRANRPDSRTPQSAHHPHKSHDEHRQCNPAGGVHFAVLLGSDNSYTTPFEIPFLIQSSSLWRYVVGGPLDSRCNPPGHLSSETPRSEKLQISSWGPKSIHQRCFQL